MQIPTNMKEKLPQGRSYPVGSEALSAALIGVPQFGALDITYWNRPAEIFASDYRELVKQQAFIPVLEVSYRNTDPGLTGSNQGIERGWYGPAWNLYVYAVPSENKKAVAKALTESGLKQVLHWLQAPRSATWQVGRKRLRLKFHLSANTLRGEERDT